MTFRFALAAAMAAGLTTLGVSAGTANAKSLRTQEAAYTKPEIQEATGVTAKRSGSPRADTNGKAASTPAGSVAAKADDNKTAEGNAAPKAKKAAARKSAGEAAKKSKAKAARKGRERIEIDPTVTAAIGKSADAKAVAVKGAYGELITRYASAYGVPVSLAHAVVRVESNYRADARGSAGEIGLMQIKPATARMMGYNGSTKDLFRPETNIKYGMKYLGEARRLGDGSTCGTILKYNAGHGAKRMNPVSSAYCRKVQAHIGG